MLRKWYVLLLALILVGLLAAPVLAQSVFEGIYTGTFSGDDRGDWAVWVLEDGSVIGGSSSSIDGTAGVLWGTVDGDGNLALTIGQVTTGATFSGQIDGSGQVSGTWENDWTNEDGTFSGAREGTNASAYAGDYTGTFSGDDSGTWAATVQSDGSTQVSTQSSVSSDTTNFTGQVGGGGTLVAYFGSIGAQATVVYAVISSSGGLDGMWGNSSEGVSGDITGQRSSSDGGGDDGGGSSGGGCFIRSLMTLD